MIAPLPIDARIGAITDSLRRRQALVLVAEPGAGKTTRVPPALLDRGPVIVLQPRRAAARAIARRIAAEQQWTVGHEVGWHVRLERAYSKGTRLLIATEGILTARLRRDPMLSDFATVVLDEFHERSVHADLALALTREAMEARPDLRVVVMSATIDPAPVSRFLGNCPVLVVEGRRHPVEIDYRQGLQADDAVEALLRHTPGNILCFQPGRAEIDRLVRSLRQRLPPGLEIVPLHGGLSADEQERALSPDASRRRVVVATNIAETSVTVPGITGVVDSGFEKVARYDAERAVDSLSLERITLAAADQRAGRAGRTGPGIAWRLWSSSDRLRPYQTPEIHRVDLASVLLSVIGWGGDPRTLRWLERPDAEVLETALRLLRRIGAVEVDRVALTAVGVRMLALPLPPRLARVFLEAGEDSNAAKAVALLAERMPPRLPHPTTTSSDILDALDRWTLAPEPTQRLAEQLERYTQTRGNSDTVSRDPRESRLLRALLAGYPERVAQRREPDSARLLLATGTGAQLGPESGVRDAEYLIALEVHAPNQPGAPDSRVRVASAIEPEWLEPTDRTIEHLLERGQVRAREVSRYGALVLRERIVSPDPDVAAELLANAWIEQPRTEDEQQCLNRLAFVGIPVDLSSLIRTAASGQTRLDAIHMEDALPYETRRRLDAEAPTRIAIPSGRYAALVYADDGTVSASVKLQELFGLAETPRIGPRREPVLLALLSPRGTPVQLTRDLHSFWSRTYPEVRKELRGRYPRHPWPDDPWNAVATHRTKPRP